MKSFYIIILLAVFSFCAFGIFSMRASSTAEEEAQSFTEKLKKGVRRLALAEFGDNTCHCAPKGGYVSYLYYESGVDPNLAFLVDHPFQTGKMSTQKLEDNQPYGLPWEKPESAFVFIPVNLDSQTYAPYFLPLNMAYGDNISTEALDEFCKNPQKDFWKGFTLRLRPSLNHGTIGEPMKLSDDEDSADKPKELDSLITPEMRKYMFPKDAGSVITTAGKIEAASKYANKLPRLKSAIIRLKIVRRGQLKRWTINKVKIDQATIITADGKEQTITNQ